jgi:hypothetical protein
MPVPVKEEGLMEVVASEEVEVDVEVEELLDELRLEFEELEESVSELTAAGVPALCEKYQKVLLNERGDEVATKIKEKSIYRCV